MTRPVHDRMPVILAPDDYERWLDPQTAGLGALRPLLLPFPAEAMIAYPVETAGQRRPPRRARLPRSFFIDVESGHESPSSPNTRPRSRPREDAAHPLREDAGGARADPEAGGGHLPHLLDVDERLRLRQRRDGPARDPGGASGRASRLTLLVKSDGGSGMASLRMVHLLRQLREAAHRGGPPQLRLGGHHAGPRRGHDPDGPALLPDRGRHVPRARPLAARPHEQPGGGEQRRGGPRDPPVEGDGGAGGTAASTPTRSSTSTSIRWSSAPWTARAASP